MTNADSDPLLLIPKQLIPPFIQLTPQQNKNCIVTLPEGLFFFNLPEETLVYFILGSQINIKNTFENYFKTFNYGMSCRWGELFCDDWYGPGWLRFFY